MNNDAEILDAWANAQRAGRSKRALAQSMGISSSVLDSRLTRAKRRARGVRGRDGKPFTARSPEEPSGRPAASDEINRDENGNNLELESKSKRIVTLDGLLSFCEVDLDVWKVDRFIVNKWEVGTKLPGGGVLTEPLIQVKAWLSKIAPQPVHLTINPITLSVKFKVRYSKRARIRRALIIPDIHVGFRRDLMTGHLDPFHDRAALDVVSQIAQDGEFDDVIYLMDMLDLAEWSDKFLRSPEFYFVTQPALLEAGWWMTQFRYATPNARHVAIEGNHELRMETSLIAHLAAAYQLRSVDDMGQPPAMSVPNLLAFEKLGIEWIGGYPMASLWLNDRLRVTHGDVVRQGPGATAQAVVMKSPTSVVFGHIHRIEWATRTVYERGKMRFVMAVSPGCLCRLDGVVPGHSLSQNWQQGAGIVHYDDSGYHSIQVVPIEAGRAVFNGVVYTARDRIEEIRSDLGNSAL